MRLQLRAIVCVEEMLAVDLNFWDGVVARRRDSAGQQRSGARNEPRKPHADADNERCLDNECGMKLLSPNAWYKQ